ncbi:MAG: protein kinase [Elusimicrobiota bacterium]|nr:MAG: protein kinase [Elusimicrobiota bacterium]
MKNPAAGLADAERVLARNPNDARGWRAKADALMQLGRLEEALSAADRALALDAGSAAGHLLRAQILEKLARVDDAVAEYREAARLDPALTPVADEALRRLGRGPAPSGPSEAVRRRLVRGGAIALSLLLVLAGLVGGARVATRRARAATASAASDGPDRTVGRGDTVAGQYTITRELGRGGMGVVFEALDERLKRPVALKQMQSDFRASPEDAARFLQEARLVAQLKHPNVAEIYAAVDDGGLFLVFELIEGKPLDKALDDGPLDPDAARRIVSELCSALAAAHSRRIIHRDLKPSNVMLAADGAAKIMDFGIAHQSRSGAAATQTSASGTPPTWRPSRRWAPCSRPPTCTRSR